MKKVINPILDPGFHVAGHHHNGPRHSGHHYRLWRCPFGSGTGPGTGVGGCETQGTDVQSATTENARLMEAVMNALGEFGSAIGAVSTGSYQVYSLEMEESPNTG